MILEKGAIIPKPIETREKNGEKRLRKYTKTMMTDYCSMMFLKTKILRSGIKTMELVI
jgi:hypothetical protein